MDLMLRAFGQSGKFTLKERANLIMLLHRQVSDLIGQYEWKVVDKKTIWIDIRDIDSSYPNVLKGVKSGLNAKVVNPIRYKEDDIADITSSCWFSNKSHKDHSVRYSIGYPSRGGFPALSIGIDNIRNENIFTKEIIHNLSLLFIKAWKPDFLCVTDRTYFHKISKATEKKIPWTGWFTYLSNDLVNQKSKKNFLGKILSFKETNLNRIGLNRIEDVNDIGKIYWTCDEYFNSENQNLVDIALKLEEYFYKAKFSLEIIHKEADNITYETMVAQGNHANQNHDS
jgi:hypothetical protein